MEWLPIYNRRSARDWLADHETTFLSMNNFFCSSLSSMSWLAGTTNTWLIRGSELRATEPRQEESLGGSRHTSTDRSRDLASVANLALIRMI